MEKPIHILLIEDDRDDVELLNDSLVNCDIPFNLQVIHDGDEAMSYLQNDNERPDVIIMDLNLPKIHGREILTEYKRSKYADIPLVVFTTSSANEDKNYSLKNGATNFLIKPHTRQGLNESAEYIFSVAGKKKITS